MQRASSAGASGDPLLRAAEKKLQLWGFDDARLKALYARGESVVVLIDYETMEKQQIPQELRAAIEQRYTAPT